MQKSHKYHLAKFHFSSILLCLQLDILYLANVNSSFRSQHNVTFLWHSSQCFTQNSWCPFSVSHVFSYVTVSIVFPGMGGISLLPATPWQKVKCVFAVKNGYPTILTTILSSFTLKVDKMALSSQQEKGRPDLQGLFFKLHIFYLVIPHFLECSQMALSKTKAQKFHPYWSPTWSSTWEMGRNGEWASYFRWCLKYDILISLFKRFILLI